MFIKRLSFIKCWTIGKDCIHVLKNNYKTAKKKQCQNCVSAHRNTNFNLKGISLNLRLGISSRCPKFWQKSQPDALITCVLIKRNLFYSLNSISTQHQNRVFLWIRVQLSTDWCPEFYQHTIFSLKNKIQQNSKKTWQLL